MSKKWVVLGFFLLAPAAFAEEAAEASSKAFDVLGGFTANKGQGLLQMGIGKPGLETKLAYGATPGFTVGGLLGLNWGEGADFVIRLHLPLRFSLHNSGKLGVAMGFTPGIALWFGGGTVVTIPLYLDLTTGYRITDALSMMVGFEIPLELWTKGGLNAFIPLVAATGFEYFVTPSLKLWSRIRAGHTFSAKKRGDGAWAAGAAGVSGAAAGFSGVSSCHVGIAVAF